MDGWFLKQTKKKIWHSVFIFTIVVLLLIFAIFYFHSYAVPYMNRNMIDISEHWKYKTSESNSLKDMEILQRVEVKTNEPLILERKLTETITNAVVMFTSNHQTIRVFLDDALIYETKNDTSNKNPGMGLHFLVLPADYIGKTLCLEVTSPYREYSGAMGSVFLGDISSLTAYAISHSMLHILLMQLCLAAGFFIIILEILRHAKQGIDWGNFSFGIFSIVWGFYFPSCDYIVYFFFHPQWVSYISIGLYYLYPLPIMLYFYNKFIYYKKAFFPVVILRLLFICGAFGLQLLGIADFPEMLNVNNPLYIISIVYLIVIGVIEAKKGNRLMRFAILWVFMAFAISMSSLISFYTTRIKQEETLYEMAVFMSIIVIWLFNVKGFFKERAEERKNIQVLELKNEMVLKTYENAKSHLEEVAFIRHEMKNHIAALHILIEGREYEKTQKYLMRLQEQQLQLSQVLYCNHNLVNAILNVNFAILKEKGVKIKYNIELSKDLNISEDDLSSLFMNIFNNAIEALEQIGEGTERWLQLKVQHCKPYLYISCTNSKKNRIQKKKGAILSSKVQKESHGYGLKIIQNIVKRLNGILNISYTEDTFTIDLAVMEDKISE